tara:strand:- start:1459 stop:2823 length:1365 start_codon:yes stop_codon:yes gene_type:complete
MDLLITIISFIALISLIVGIHELGHFSVARYFNIHVLKFKIGFGKELFSFQGKNDCKYSLGILPLGGYVQMLGENVIQEDQENSNLLGKKSYLDATLKERAAVTAAGPAANFLLAIVIYFLIALIGTTHLGSYVGGVSQGSLAEEANIGFRDKIVSIDATKLDTFNEINVILSKRIGHTGSVDIGFIKEGSNITSYSTVDITNWLSTSDQSNPARSFGIEPLVPPVIGGLLEDGPASRVGLQSGDIIQSVNRNSINSWSQLSEVLSKLPNEAITISVIRENETFLYSLRTDSFNQNNVNKGRIGIFASNDLTQWPEEMVIYKKENFLNAILYGIEETYKFTNLILVSIGKMITGSISAENIGGPIQISALAGSAAKAGLVSFLSMIAILSINLGLINLLPIPVLDGGQLLMIAIEKVKGSPVSENFLEHSIRIGILLIASLMIFAFVNDIVRLI